MTLNIPLSPETAARLRERAEAEGKDIETFVQDVLAEKLSKPSVPGANGSHSLEEWEKQLDNWINSFPRIEGDVDDSRESHPHYAR